MLDLACIRQQERLVKVRLILGDMAVGRERIALQQHSLRQRADTLLEQAEQDVSGDEEVVRPVIRLLREAFRTRTEMLKAEYTAAEAHARICEATGGISEEVGDIDCSVGVRDRGTPALDDVLVLSATACALVETV